MRLIYYKPRAMLKLADERFAGTMRLRHYFGMYGAGACPIDRTGTIRTPVKTLSLFPIPAFEPFAKTFEQICDERAAEILARARALNVRIYVLWSGGIDSTLLLISLFKQASKEDRERIIVLMSNDSIQENPRFFREHVSGAVELGISADVPKVLGGEDIIVTGEHNDQLFGADLMGPITVALGPAIMHQPLDLEMFAGQFARGAGSIEMARWYMALMDRVRAAAPIPLTTNYDFAWWINFTLKWQTVYSRLLMFVEPSRAHLITKDWLESRYVPFYNTDDFQRWSLHNNDKKVKDTWASYKWPCKDIIYDYTHDAEYRDTKTKVGSLGSLMLGYDSLLFIDEDFGMHNDLTLRDIYEPENDFR